MQIDVQAKSRRCHFLRIEIVSAIEAQRQAFRESNIAHERHRLRINRTVALLINQPLLTHTQIVIHTQIPRHIKVYKRRLVGRKNLLLLRRNRRISRCLIRTGLRLLAAHNNSQR